MLPLKQNCEILILGSFQIIHSGHLKLIQKAREIKQRRGGLVAITHFFPAFNKYTLSQPEVIEPLLRYLGVDLIITIRTDTPFMYITKEEFLRWLRLVGVKGVICGEDLRFGANAEGGVKDLIREFGEHSTHILRLVKLVNKDLSTSLINPLMSQDKGLFKLIFPVRPIFFLKHIRVNTSVIKGARLPLVEGSYLGYISPSIETLLEGGGERRGVIVIYKQKGEKIFLSVYSLLSPNKISLTSIDLSDCFLSFEEKF